MAPRFSTPLRVAAVAFALIAVAGWGMFAFTLYAQRQAEDHFNGQITSLQENQALLLKQKNEADQKLTELGSLRQQLEAAQQERADLAQELAAVRSELAALKAKPTVEDQPGGLDDSTAALPASPQETVKLAQEALTKLGYGRLVADGVVGPGTRRAIERFQRDQGLTVNGQPDPATMGRLIALQQGAGSTR